MTRDGFAEVWNAWQWRLTMGALYLAAVVEITDAVLRRLRVPVELISQTCTKRIAFNGYDVFAFFMGSMTVHWCITQNRLPWSEYPTVEKALAVVFWAIFATYLLGAWFDPDRRYWPAWVQFFRDPGNAAVFGGFCAWLFFSQRSPYALLGPR